MHPSLMPRKKGTLPSGFARDRERGLHAPAGRHVLLLRKREDVDFEARVVGGGKVAHVLFGGGGGGERERGGGERRGEERDLNGGAIVYHLGGGTVYHCGGRELTR